MRAEKQIKLNEWLLGSTILCRSCGCLWLVPTAQGSEIYQCRQCGSSVTTKVNGNADEPTSKKNKA